MLSLPLTDEQLNLQRKYKQIQKHCKLQRPTLACTSYAHYLDNVSATVNALHKSHTTLEDALNRYYVCTSSLG